MEKIAIVGAGITGSAIARVLSKYKDFEIHLIEKEPDVGWGASKANTGIIHPGHEDDPEEYPLRAELCVQGNQIWHNWVKELDIPVRWPGELMVATQEDDFDVLKKYLNIGKENGVPGLRIIDGDRTKSLEPNVTSDVEGALWAPTAGLIEPWEAVIGLVENAVDNGVSTHMGTEVKDVKVEDEEIEGIETSEGFMEVDTLINAAGLFADEISEMAGIDDFEVYPRKGEYYLFDEDATPKVDKVVHPTPTAKTKGVFANKTVEGNLMLGPTAENLPKDKKDDKSTTESGLDYVWEWSEKLLEDLPPKKGVAKTFSGLRPEPPEGKWKIEAYDSPRGFVNVAGIRSPGLASAPAIANYVKNELLQKKVGLEFVEKDNWNPNRKSIKRFSECSLQEQRNLIDKDSNYGNVVCLCKEVTKAEINEAIKRMDKIGIENKTLDGVKFRTLAMFGFCQGSFCRVRLARILSEKTDKPIWDIPLNGPNSEYGLGDVKDLQEDSEDK